MSLTILPSMSLLISSVETERADCAAIDYSYFDCFVRRNSSSSMCFGKGCVIFIVPLLGHSM